MLQFAASLLRNRLYQTTSIWYAWCVCEVAWPLPVRTALSRWVLLIVVKIFRLLDHRDRVFFGGPCAQIDLLATLGTKRAELVLFDPFDFFTAGGAIDDSRHDIGTELKAG